MPLLSLHKALAACGAAVLAAANPCHRGFAAALSGGHGSDLRWRDQAVSVQSTARGGMRRAYHFFKHSDSGHADRLVSESIGTPYLRSGNTLFDGLFAMGIADAELNRVSHIRDASFNDGHAIDCVCFETGEKWPYVWTRDISYAVDLGLASVDPKRALNSLLFKTSGIRADALGGQLKPVTVVAQDTGSGGSWPVSSDRVVWIMAASDVLEYLAKADRPHAAAKLYGIARDTVEQDRRFVFDAYAGLYRGETSFLDWREQNYPIWTRNDVASIASGYAFSTNVLHVIALRRTAQLARAAGEEALAARYSGWAVGLQRVINARFWQAETGFYASYLSAEPNSVPSSSYDLLGLSLAIVNGIADEKQAHSILEHYPISAAGPPVVWPEQADVAIYHNRAIWPFVTAYALRAAKIAKHAELAEELAESLMRGAALSLSNMENFEFLSQQVRFEDGMLSGPVIDSARQLWSVAGYLGMVQNTFWGLEIHSGQLSIDPWLPSRLAHKLFASQRPLVLHDVRVGGTLLNVALELPKAWPSNGWLESQSMSLNGRKLRASAFSLRRLRPGRNDLRVTMRAVGGSAQSVARIPFGDSGKITAMQRRALFAPASPPEPDVKRENTGVVVSWPATLSGASVQIYRNGRLLTAKATGERFVDRAISNRDLACYALTQRFDDTGLTSLTSRETCISDADSTAIFTPDKGLAPNDGAVFGVIDGVARFVDWGRPTQQLRFNFAPRVAGWYRLTLKYANTHGPINTGITAAVKTVTARCGSEAGQVGSVAMPHLGELNSWGFSTGFFFKASSGAGCELSIGDGFNMSYLSHFARYTGGQGGVSGALNRGEIAAAQVDLIRSAAP
ncbi:MAG TPA: hypothetical protein VGO37_00455 [Steroidobacteraceae bacterium]|nr:hypothetical protein [Steroidobacteraceae bacterium]